MLLPCSSIIILLLIPQFVVFSYALKVLIFDDIDII